MSKNQFRYSQSSFRASVLAALGLTAIVSFLVWLFSQLFGLSHYNVITAVSGLIFFGFCSAAMILRYMRREVVVAVRPDGLLDSRVSADPVPWDMIKDIRLGRVENEFRLSVILWPEYQDRSATEDQFIMDLAPLDGGLEQVVTAVQAYKPVTIPRG